MFLFFAGFLSLFVVMAIVFARAERARAARHAASHEREQRFVDHVRGIIEDHGGALVDAGRSKRKPV